MNDSLPVALYRGTLEIGDSRIPCAVLEDGTRVISETGIANALLGSRSGASMVLKKELQESGSPLPVFLAPTNLKPFIDADLITGSLIPIKYLDGKRIVLGFDAMILPKACDVWLRAREAQVLQKSQLTKALKAETLMRGLAHTGIIALVDEATGYQEKRDRDELQRFLAMYLSEEKLKWAKTFPDEFYKQLFRLKNWTYKPMTVKRPQIVGKLTNLLVYEKLPANVINELRRLNPVVNKKTGRRGAAHFQHLSKNLGQPDLRDHLLQVIAVMKASSNWSAFVRNFNRAFPPSDFEQVELDIGDE